jgi:hypothetical protein
MVGQLDLHRAFHHPLRQLREQPALTGDLFTGPRSSHELIEQLVGQKLLDPISQRVTVRAARSANASLRSPPRELTPCHAGAPKVLIFIQPAVNCARHRSPVKIRCPHSYAHCQAVDRAGCQSQWTAVT